MSRVEDQLAEAKFLLFCSQPTGLTLTPSEWRSRVRALDDEAGRENFGTLVDSEIITRLADLAQERDELLEVVMSREAPEHGGERRP